MEMIKCKMCQNKVPPAGQCNKCGFLENPKHMPPTMEDFVEARKINKKSNYKQYDNIDMRVVDL